LTFSRLFIILRRLTFLNKHKIETEELYQYEKKYKMRSEVFFKIIVGTPAEDTPDFLTWASCYRSYFRLFQSKFSVKGVAYAV